jgi:2-polyprenyl-3-methyl-5-hydroxy-6-metoxy-1,4-benzoquinol methylase
MEFVARAEYATRGYGTFTRGSEWLAASGNLHELGVSACMDDFTHIVFLSDDCIVSKGWLTPIAHYYEWNEALKVGMVSGTMIEAWEMAMNGIIAADYLFYDYKGDGTLLREHLTFNEALYDEARANGKVQLTSYEPMGPINESGKYELTHPIPLQGGMGPCFTISAEAFLEVKGFTNCLYLGNYEAMLGWKCWDAGYVCVQVPSPPVLHARGVATSELPLLTLEQLEPHRLWSESALKRFQQYWGGDSFDEVQKRYQVKQDRAVTMLKNSRFIHTQTLKFPINITYNTLGDINLGPIHWEDARQQQRMSWIAARVCARGESVLDVGCATGGLVNFLSNNNPTPFIGKYTGADLDRVRIDEAKRSHPLGQFYVLDATYGLPFADKAFDAVVCADCLEHVPRKAAQRLLVDLARCAASTLIITLPISAQTIPNVDHVWESHPTEVQEFLKCLEEAWCVAVEFLEDFALIECTPKA